MFLEWVYRRVLLNDRGLISIIIPERTFHYLYMMCLRLAARTDEPLPMCLLGSDFLVIVHKFVH